MTVASRFDTERREDVGVVVTSIKDSKAVVVAIEVVTSFERPSVEAITDVVVATTEDKDTDAIFTKSSIIYRPSFRARAADR